MTEALEWLKQTFDKEMALRLAGVAGAVLVMLIVYKLLRSFLRRGAFKKLKPQAVALVERGIKYVFVVCVVLYVLDLFGVNLSALLGAAGIAGIAVGFAAQTSVSNIISGFFVLSEHVFTIGDFVTIDGISGTVDSVNLLSVRLLTPDNQLVRVPNESVIETKVINMSYNPKRRFSMPVRVSYRENLEEVEAALLKIAAETELVLSDPAPRVLFDELSPSSVNLILAVWCKKEDYLSMKNNIIKSVHKGLRAANIELPFPQMDVHVGGRGN